MLLPTSLYDRAPQFWLLLGLLFMTAGIYRGFGHALAFLYIGVGFFSLAWSFGIYVMRSRHRRARRRNTIQPLDRTQPIDVTVTEVFRREAGLAGPGAERPE